MRLLAPGSCRFPEVAEDDHGEPTPKEAEELARATAASNHMDRRFKPTLYAEAGIPAYWRLENDPASMLVISELHGGRYTKITTAVFTWWLCSTYPRTSPLTWVPIWSSSAS